MGVLVIDGVAVEVPFATRTQMGILPTRARSKPVRQIILHHDACRSAADCIRVLQYRQLSTHCIIDNDGTVVQVADLGRVAWHAKGEYKNAAGKTLWAVGFNRQSIGIDISNAVLPKYLSAYKPPRRIGTIPVQGKPMTGMFPYECQITAAMSLIRFLCGHFQIPAITRDVLEWLGDITPTTPGVWGHAQICQAKCDPFGFPFELIAEGV